MMICVTGVLVLRMCVCVCVMMRVDVLSLYFFHVFRFLHVRVYVHKLCAYFCLIFATIFHVRGISSSCIFVSSCLAHTVSVISDDLKIVSVQCIVGFFV